MKFHFLSMILGFVLILEGSVLHAASYTSAKPLGAGKSYYFASEEVLAVSSGGAPTGTIEFLDVATAIAYPLINATEVPAELRN